MGITRTILKLVLGATALTAITSGSAYAVGTAAGVDVENTFTLNYNVGSTGQTEITNNASPTTFKVDRFIDLIVDADAPVSVVPGANDQEIVFSLVNQGNGTQDFALDLDQPGSDDFDTTGVVVTYDVIRGGSTIVTGATYDLTDPAEVLNDIQADDEVIITVSSDIAISRIDDDVAEFILSATALTTAGVALDDSISNTLLGEETVFGDAAGTASGDGVTDAVHSDTTSYFVATADLSGDKSVVVKDQEAVDADCINQATFAGITGDALYAIPGACVEYTITVENDTDASAFAEDIAIFDTLDANLIFQSASYSASFDDERVSPVVAATLVQPAAATTTCTGVAGTTAAPGVCDIYLSGGVLAPGATGTITIRATVQ